MKTLKLIDVFEQMSNFINLLFCLSDGSGELCDTLSPRQDTSQFRKDIPEENNETKQGRGKKWDFEIKL